MRQIKFRVWDGSELHTVETIHFDIGMIYVNSKCDALGCEGHPQDFSFDEVVIMQYTGLKDENDKEIYEGDIVQYKYRNLEKAFGMGSGDDWEVGTRKIIYTGQSFNVPEGLKKDLEVIGNIYENHYIK